MTPPVGHTTYYLEPGLAKKKTTPEKNTRPLWPRIKSFVSSALRKSLRIGVILAIVLITAPALLTLLYVSPAIKPVSTLMMGRWLTAQPVTRQWVALDTIRPVLIHSVMMSEDAKFCQHSGVDWPALNQVFDDAMEGERTRGASTLSMQTVKNLFLWPGRSYIRKLLELPLALLADAIWSKRRMIEIYLNIAEWDEGIFGIEAASRRYFKRSASNLTPRQAALLAVTLPNPKKRNPAKASASLSRLAATIERRARQSGAYIKCVKPTTAK